MKAAWLASIAAQALLAFTLYRAGQRDWWTLYLSAGVIRAGFLWQLLGTDAYWWVWMVTEPIDQVFKFACAWQIAARAQNPSWVYTGMSVALLFSSLGSVLSPEAWPLAKRARLLLLQFGTFGSAGVLLGAYAGGSAPQTGMALYFLADVARAIGEMFTRDRASMDELNLIYLLALTLLMTASALPHYFPRKVFLNRG
jgi:hypothetical protein